MSFFLVISDAGSVIIGVISVSVAISTAGGADGSMGILQCS
jgi:hypothetical protein